MTLIPAYGRDYRSRKEVQEAFDANKDFIVQDISDPADGKPTNREDLIRARVQPDFVESGNRPTITKLRVLSRNQEFPWAGSPAQCFEGV